MTTQSAKERELRAMTVTPCGRCGCDIVTRAASPSGEGTAAQQSAGSDASIAPERESNRMDSPDSVDAAAPSAEELVRLDAADYAELRYWRQCNSLVMRHKDMATGLSHEDKICELRAKAVSEAATHIEQSRPADTQRKPPNFGNVRGPVHQPTALSAAEIEFANCTLCSQVESDGFYTGCMAKDYPTKVNGWKCDGKGHLTRAKANSPRSAEVVAHTIRRIEQVTEDFDFNPESNGELSGRDAVMEFIHSDEFKDLLRGEA